MRRLAITLIALASIVTAAPSAQAQKLPLEDLAPYQPASHCSPRAKLGTVVLGKFIVRRFGGGFGRISESCTKDSDVHSEHQEGRAFDWMVSVKSKADRARVDRLFAWLFASDAVGDVDVRARRIGLMYLIWNDHIYSAGDGFQPRPYLNSGCKKRKKCSATLRHRNHVHLSLTRAGGKGRTSWFVGRLPS